MIKQLKEKMLLWIIEHASSKTLNYFLHYTKTNPNTTYPKHGLNALMSAILCQKLESAEVLIQHGADVNATYNDASVLDTALTLPDDKALNLLLKYRVNLNEEINPISIAVLRKNMRAVWRLTDEGVDINKAKDAMYSPIYMALDVNDSKVLYHLLQVRGIDINKRGTQNITPLIEAIIMNKTEHALLLIEKKADVNAVCAKGFRAMDIAVNKNNLEVAKALIDAKAKLNYANPDNKTLLMLSKSQQMTELLVQKGCDVNFGNDYGETPLLYAIVDQNTEKAKYLINKGADLSLVSDQGYSPLFVAVAYEEKEIIQLLLEKKCPIDTADNEGRTPLFIALESQQYDVVKTLLEHGANPNIFYHGIPIGALIAQQQPGFLPLLKRMNQKYNHQIKPDSPKQITAQKGKNNSSSQYVRE